MRILLVDDDQPSSLFIVGGVLFVAGIVITAAGAGSLAGRFLQENTIISQTFVRPSESINATLQVNDNLRPISVAFRFDPGSANVTLRETVTDPFGRIINTNEFSKRLLTTFKVDTVGKFTLTLLNQGSSPVNVDGVFGYIPFVGENNQVNLNPLNSLLIGISLFIIGIIVMIVGIVYNYRQKKRKPAAS